MLTAMQQGCALVFKDIRCIWRAQSVVAGLSTFVFVVTVVASLALRQVGMAQDDILRIAPGVLWLINAFAAVMALHYVSGIEQDDGAALGLVCAGVDSAVLFLSKWLSASALLFFTQLVALCTLSLLLTISLFGVVVGLLEIMLLASLGLAGVGVLVSSVSVQLQRQELLTPILLFPLCLPLLCAAVLMSADVFLSHSIDRSDFWYMLLLSVPVLMASLGTVLYEQVLR